jgi:hypothetical protein
VSTAFAIFAVNALRNGVGVFEVARNMGASVQMIHEYYGKQATPTVFATRQGTRATMPPAKFSEAAS